MNSKILKRFLLPACFVLLASSSCRNAAEKDIGSMAVVTRATLPAGVEYKVLKESLFRSSNQKIFDARYEALLGDFPDGYADWSMKAGSRLDTVGMEPPGGDERFAQFLVELANKGSSPTRLNLSTADGKSLNLVLKLPDGEELPVWEFLGSGMVSDYESLGAALSGHGEEVVLNLSFEGQLYCDLAPGQRAWLALLFRLPPGVGD